MKQKKNLSGLFIGIALICVSITAFTRALNKEDKPKETAKEETVQEETQDKEVYSDDFVTITYTGRDKRNVSFKIENNSDSKYEVLVEDTYIDDEKQEPVLFIVELEAGKLVNKDLMFYDEISGDKLEVQFAVRDIDTFSLLSDTGLVEIPIND